MTALNKQALREEFQFMQDNLATRQTTIGR